MSIFLDQKQTYGINYKEINKLLMSKKVYEKDYDSYKLLLDTQYQDLLEKSMEQ